MGGRQALDAAPVIRSTRMRRDRRTDEPARCGSPRPVPVTSPSGREANIPIAKQFLNHLFTVRAYSFYGMV
jgi:hypothetical protein